MIALYIIVGIVIGIVLTLVASGVYLIYVFEGTWPWQRRFWTDDKSGDDLE